MRRSQGSSPLTRGKHALGGEAVLQRRLIPAHAGKTPARRGPPPASRAHPRSRGENVVSLVGAIVAMGSSPLTRGKRASGGARCGLRRLIPAHAGKTRGGTRSRLCARAHPRSRGENVFQVMRIWPRSGSSPLTRGKLARHLSRRHRVRLIPAHAGKTRSDHGRRNRARAHPRSRGENVLAAPMIVLIWGSSPLTRGKQGPGKGSEPGERLIPAHAGKTREGVQVLGKAGAHPRSRGENLVIWRMSTRECGSSPLTRGKRPRCRCGRRPRRLIPAHAGKTMRRPRRRGKFRAHPRSRGENEAGDEKGSTFDGSSPLTRGKPFRGCR